MVEIVRKFKGGSLSETLLLKKGGELFVRKTISVEQNREYGLVRWHSQIRKMQLLHRYLPENSIPVVGSGKTSSEYYFDIPFVETAQNGYEYILGGGDPAVLANALIDIIQMMSSVRLEGIIGEFSVYTNEEIMRPLEFAVACEGITDQVDFEALSRRIERLVPKLDELTRGVDLRLDNSLTHGNLTLENVLWDSTNSKVILIDPYGETYGETLIGDISQIYQSCASGYDHINRQEFDPSSPYPWGAIPRGFGRFTEIMDDYVRSESWIDPRLLLIFRGSQFTRMFPFKVDNDTNHAYLFLLHGIELLEEALTC